ncbi:MAG: SRPBCC family protein [Betaproteobacteria bacterium]
MKVLKYTLLGLAGLLVLLGMLSLALPSAYKVERSIVINAPIEVVYPLVYDPKAWARWGVWNRRDPGMKVTYSGSPAGVGAKWSWESKSEGNGTMECTGAEFNRSVSYKLTFSDFDGAFNGRLEFTPADKGVQVKWIAEGDVGSNPLMRYFALVMDRMMGPDFEGSLKNLKEMAERPRRTL